MKEPLIGQLLYGNVEKRLSPSGKGGFQTLFYSHEVLSQTDVEEIEERLVFMPSEYVQRKWIFFCTSSGKPVFGQITASGLTDDFGRKGGYLAHMLILTEGNLHLTGKIFSFLRNFKFATHVEEALALGTPASRDIPLLRMDFPAEENLELAAATLWEKEELKKLVLAALKSQELAQKGLGLCLVGSACDVERALEAALIGVPHMLRLACSFDTFFQGSSLSRIYYWAVGAPNPIPSPCFIAVDVHNHCFLEPLAFSPSNLYERWVVTQIDNGTWENLPAERESVASFCNWLKSAAAIPYPGPAISFENFTSLFTLDPAPFQDALIRCISAYLPDLLARKLGKYMHQRNDINTMYRVTHGTIDIQDFLDELWKTYSEEKYRRPDDAEVEALGETLKMAEHPDLRLLYHSWKLDRKALQKVLSEIPEPKYMDFVQIASRYNLVPLVWLVMPGRGGAFAKAVVSTEVSEAPGIGGWGDIIDTLVAQGETSCLSILADVVKNWQLQDKQRIKQILRGVPGVPQVFQRALDA